MTRPPQARHLLATENFVLRKHYYSKILKINHLTKIHLEEHWPTASITPAKEPIYSATEIAHLPL